MSRQGGTLTRECIPAIVEAMHVRRTRRHPLRVPELHRHVDSVAEVIDCWVRWNA